MGDDEAYAAEAISCSGALFLLRVTETLGSHRIGLLGDIWA